MTKHPARRRRAGFASFVAVALLGTTAVALTAVAAVTLRQAQRSSDAATDAQLRQLLLAGQATLDAPPDERGAFEREYLPALPDALDDGTATLRLETARAADGPAHATITATLRGRTATMTLVYFYDPETRGRWQVVNVELP